MDVVRRQLTTVTSFFKFGSEENFDEENQLPIVNALIEFYQSMVSKDSLFYLSN